MNTNYINSCFRWLINELFPYYNLKKLPNDLMLKMDTFYDSVNKTFDWYNPSKTDLLKLGFINWEDHSVDDCTAGVWFIPCWLFPVIPEGMTLYDTSEKPFLFKKEEASKKTMYGCLTYGVKIT